MAGVLTSDDLAAIAALLVDPAGGVRLADGVAHGGSTATLELGSNDGDYRPALHPCRFGVCGRRQLARRRRRRTGAAHQRRFRRRSWDSVSGRRLR